MADCLCENIDGGITIGCDDNFPGLRAFYLTEKCNITSLALSSPGDEISTITMVGLALFYKFEFTKKSGSNYVETTNAGDNGSQFTTQVITLNFNRREKTKRDTLLLIGKFKDLVGIGTDNNGINWYFGEINGINMTSVTGGSGENSAGTNGYTVVLTGEEPEEANTVTDAALAAVI
jgi:hypothetical protein